MFVEHSKRFKDYFIPTTSEITCNSQNVLVPNTNTYPFSVNKWHSERQRNTARAHTENIYCLGEIVWIVCLYVASLVHRLEDTLYCHAFLSDKCFKEDVSWTNQHFFPVFFVVGCLVLEKQCSKVDYRPTDARTYMYIGPTLKLPVNSSKLKAPMNAVQLSYVEASSDENN